MEHYHKVHTTYVVDFTFTTNITFLTGDSGQGRSVVFSFLEEDAVKNSQLLCFNYLDWQKDIKSLITGAEGKLIDVYKRQDKCCRSQDRHLLPRYEAEAGNCGCSDEGSPDYYYG